MKKGNIVITVISVIILFGFLFLVYSLTNKPQNTSFPEIAKLKPDDHIKWSSTNKNILVEYSDFQCPACGNFFGFEKQIEASGSPNLDLIKKFTFVYRHFPLFQVHPNAYAGAYAAEAAGRQGKFWEMHDLLFKNQNQWADSPNAKDLFAGFAKSLNLDVEKFKQDEDSKEVKQRVDEDLIAAEKAGANSTPTLFLNGQKLDFNSYDELLQTLKTVQ